MGGVSEDGSQSTLRVREAGTQRYSVGMDTPRFLATFLGEMPLASSLLADSIRPTRDVQHLNGPKTAFRVKLSPRKAALRSCEPKSGSYPPLFAA